MLNLPFLLLQPPFFNLLHFFCSYSVSVEVLFRESTAKKDWLYLLLSGLV
jgi:hypothetical protein